MTFEFHEAANLFPFDEGHIQELADDIKARGLLVPVEVLPDGRVIDGRRRLRACELVGVSPTLQTVDVQDPVAYVLSLNLHRRHLTPSQLAMVAARARDIYDRQAKERMIEGAKRGPANLPDPSDARDAAGKAVGVSGKSVDFATKVLATGVPELVVAVDEGKVAVSKAASIAGQPAEVQQAYLVNAGDRKRKQERPTKATTAVQANQGIAIRYANEAVDRLKKIPANDPLRQRGFRIVTDWIRLNP